MQQLEDKLLTIMTFQVHRGGVCSTRAGTAAYTKYKSLREITAFFKLLMCWFQNQRCFKFAGDWRVSVAAVNNH